MGRQISGGLAAQPRWTIIMDHRMERRVGVLEEEWELWRNRAESLPFPLNFCSIRSFERSENTENCPETFLVGVVVVRKMAGVSLSGEDATGLQLYPLATIGHSVII